MITIYYLNTNFTFNQKADSFPIQKDFLKTYLHVLHFETHILSLSNILTDKTSITQT